MLGVLVGVLAFAALPVTSSEGDGIAAGRVAVAHAVLEENMRCGDRDTRCSGWASSGECGKNPTYMKANCRHSCGECDAVYADTLFSRYLVETALYGLRSVGCPSTHCSDVLGLPPATALPNALRELATRAASHPPMPPVRTTPRDPSPPAPPFTVEGLSIPPVGFGTWQLTGDACREAVRMALQVGYRHFDTAEVYGNEAEVGDALSTSRIPRDELFVATKLGVASYGGDVRRTFFDQKKKLRVDYLDLYMLHGVSGDRKAMMSAWRTMEGLHREGHIRWLGVSNFEFADLAHLLQEAVVPPRVLQNKFSPFHPGTQYRPDTTQDVFALAREHKIQIVGYSLLNPWPALLPPLRDPVVLDVARRIRISPAQVLVKWALQLGVAVIPRTTSHRHMRDNLDAATMPPLSPQDMRRISALHTLVESPWNRPPALNSLFYPTGTAAPTPSPTPRPDRPGRLMLPSLILLLPALGIVVGLFVVRRHRRGHGSARL